MVFKIPLSMGFVALIDDDDYEVIASMNWRVSGAGTKRVYAVTGTKPAVYMHRLITECPPGFVVDHLNEDGLDNRRCNLRVCTHRENIARSNTAPKQSASGFIGVFRNKHSLTFYAKLSNRRLGAYRRAEDAARAYDAAARAEFGEYARLNFPGEHAPAPPREDNRLGDIPYKGVSSFRGKFRARVTVDGKEKHVGVFSSLEEAVAARAAFVAGASL
jgi:hypothetical protein